MQSKSERDPAGSPDSNSNKTKTANFALQVSGAHCAFTYGVLDRLLDDDSLALEGVSATSEFVTRKLSPYQFNPANYDPLREVVEQSIDFRVLRRPDWVREVRARSSVLLRELT